MDQAESKGRRDDTSRPNEKIPEIGRGTGDGYVIQAVPYTDEEYKSLYFKTFNKMGRAVIVNNLSESQKRDGRLKTKLEELKKKLGELKFEPISTNGPVAGKVDMWEYGNLTTESVKTLMDTASRNDFNDHYCLFIIILTYGKDGVLEFGTKTENRVEITTLQEKFKGIPTLNMKPKIFFIQASDRLEERPDDVHGRDQVSVRKIPREADFFTYLYDLRTIVFQEEEPDREFMFVDTLKEALEEHVRKPRQNDQEPMEISKLSIRMNAMIEDKLTSVKDYDFQFNDGDMKIPCVTDLLTKRMNFNYGDPKKRKEC